MIWGQDARTAADLLKSCFRQEDIIARIGGDEFAVLLPNCSTEILQQAVRRIREAVDGHNRRRDALYLSMSVGSAMGDETTDVKDTFKLADNDMYREKLHRSIREPDAATGLLLRTLGKRDYVDDGHAERLIVLVDKMAVALNLPGATLEKLRLLAKFHDIGKLGIPGGILFKKAPLTEQEWQQVRQHCEIGHRIALSIPALAPLPTGFSNIMNGGTGRATRSALRARKFLWSVVSFPLPTLMKIMTGNRVYRRALSYEQAAAELRACAGKQFAPELTEIFLSLLKNKRMRAGKRPVKLFRISPGGKEVLLDKRFFVILALTFLVFLLFYLGGIVYFQADAERVTVNFLYYAVFTLLVAACHYLLVTLIIRKKFFSRLQPLVKKVKPFMAEQRLKKDQKGWDEIALLDRQIDGLLNQLAESRTLVQILENLMDLVSVLDPDRKLSYASPSHKTCWAVPRKKSCK